MAVKDFKIHAKENFKMATETCGCLEFQNSKWPLRHETRGEYRRVDTQIIEKGEKFKVAAIHVQ